MPRTLSRPFLSIASLLAGMALLLPLPASAQDSDGDKASQALVGWWEEYAPASNIVHFGVDGVVTLHLLKGEVGTLRTLDGTWKIEGDDALQMVFFVNGKTLEHKAKLSFPGQEMVLTETNGTLTKHRRHSGKLPDKYVW